MPARAPSNLMRPFVVLALPGMYLLYKYNQYRQQQMETARRRVTERELMHLNTKINSDIVLMLDSAHVHPHMSFEDRFNTQAPLVKCYAEAIANECPKAFIIICATPIDCMVPIVAQTLRSCGWYDPAKVLGSVAVPEMRASTMAAMSLGLDPRYVKVPCVGGTEGDTLVPLFSRAVDYYDFCEETAIRMTQIVRSTDRDLLRREGVSVKSAELSEAHAITRLITTVAHALLCCDIPRVSGFVESNTCQIVSPAKYLAIDVLLNHKGICHQFQFPHGLNTTELVMIECALMALMRNVNKANNWFGDALAEDLQRSKTGMKTHFFTPKYYKVLGDCAHHAMV